MSKPKYLPIPKKIPYNIRLPKHLLDSLNAYAELTGNTTTDIVIGALNDFIKDKTVSNTYLSNIKGISFKLPMISDEKEMITDSKVDLTAYNTISEEIGYKPTASPYEILKIPNNLDVFTETFGYITPVNRVATKDKHSGIEFAVIPEYYSYYDNSDDVFGALYCLFIESDMDNVTNIELINYMDAINKANEVGNVTLKNNILQCINELKELEYKVNHGAFNGVETTESGVDAVIYAIMDELEKIANKYNTGNVTPLGKNIGNAVVTAKVNENPEYFDVFMDDVMDNTEKYVDEIVADKVAEIVDYRLTNIEKLVRYAKSKDEILTAIGKNKIKTDK